MRRISREEAREADRRAVRELGVPSICLMENAGAGAAAIALELVRGLSGEVLCLAGLGGNGGDALVVARHLASAGRRVRVVLAVPSGDAEPRGDAGLQYAICTRMRLPLSRLTAERDLTLPGLAQAALVVDGLFGTGLTRPLAGLDAAVVEAVNSSRRQVLALDLPSGLDCDTGEPLGACVRASVTATFLAEKAGFTRPGSREFTGEVRVVPLGIPLPGAGTEA